LRKLIKAKILNMPELEEQYSQAYEADLARQSAGINEQQYQYALGADRARYQKMQAENSALMQSEQQEKAARMGWGFFLFLLLICVILDVIDVVTAGTLGWLIGLFGDLLLSILAGMSKSGRKQFKKLLIGFIGESIPIIDILPLRSIMLIWSFISSRSAILQTIGKVASLGQAKQSTV
jgi:hypothetical protein